MNTYLRNFFYISLFEIDNFKRKSVSLRIFELILRTKNFNLDLIRCMNFNKN